MVSKGQKQSPKTLPKDLREIIRDVGEGMAYDVKKQTGIIPSENPQDNLLYDSEKRSLPPEYYPQKIERRLPRKQEWVVFSAQEQSVKMKVITLQEELKRLSRSVNNLSQKIQDSVQETVPTPGIYHENFFEKLISFIKSLTKKVDKASTWVSAVNSRLKKKPFYWAQINKSGSKYMLSADRYMSTQAG